MDESSEDEFKVELEEDNWYHDSINRYEKLIMFEIEHSVHQIVQTDESMIMVLSKRRGKKDYLTELRLPHNLMKRLPHERAAPHQYDMKIMSGLFLDVPTSQILVNRKEKIIYASEQKLRGVSIYHLSNSLLDRINRVGAVKQCLTNPHMALNDELLLLSKGMSYTSLVVDTRVNALVKSVLGMRTPLRCPDTVLPFWVSRHLFGLSQVRSGNAVVHDMRTDSPVGVITWHSWDGTTWAVGTNYYGEQEADYVRDIALISSKGMLRVYDARMLHVPRTAHTLPLPLEYRGACKGVRFNPALTGVVSIVGFDGTVRVYNVRQAIPRLVFNHDGHDHTDNCRGNTITTSHIWYPQTGDNCIISGAANSSINCWQYEARFNDLDVPKTECPLPFTPM